MLLVFVLFISLSACGWSSDSEPVKDLRSKIAFQMQAYMNLSVDPCSNFYEYACGGWISNTTLPADRDTYARTFQGMTDRVTDILYDIVKSASHTRGDRLGIMWVSCMDKDAIDAAGLKPYFEQIKMIASISDLNGLFHHLGMMEKKHAGFFFNVQVEVDSTNTSRYIVGAHQAGLTMERYRYVSPQTNRSADLLEYFKRIHSLSGLQLSQSDVDVHSAIYNVVSLENQIAQFSKSKEDLRDPLTTLNMRSVQNCSDESGLDFLAYLKSMGFESLTQSSYINVEDPGFLKRMGELLRSTPLPVLKDSVMLRTIVSMSELLPRRFQNEYFRFFFTTLRGISKPQPLYKKCIRFMDQLLGDDLGQRFLKGVNFSDKQKQFAISFVDSIMEQYQRSLGNVSWMDEPTRQAAITKLHKVKVLMGYPTTWTKYDSLKVYVGKFADNVLRAREYSKDVFISLLSQPVDPYRFQMTVPTINAYYDPKLNSINFPAGILHLPFFTSEPNIPLAFNFGGIGTVIGHELGHGFDDIGRKYDGDGVLSPWWPQEVADRFKEQGECLGNQYASIGFPEGLHIKPELTMGENIADNGGVSVAFKAFLTKKGSNPDDELIPGISDRKLFWIAYAQDWCSIQTIEGLRRQLATDPHSPSMARVNVPLMNNEEFARDFQCPIGSNLNPTKRCIIW